MSSSIDNRLKLLEIVTNKLNPRYKKDIIPLKELDISKNLIDKAKKYSINLRGLEESIKVEDENTLQILPNSFITGEVNSIVRIDNKTLAFGGSDKVIIVDISDRENPKKFQR